MGAGCQSLKNTCMRILNNVSFRPLAVGNIVHMLHMHWCVQMQLTFSYFFCTASILCQASCTLSSAFSSASMDGSMLSGLLATCISSGRKQRVLLSALSRFTKTMAKCIALKDRKIDSGPKQSISQASHSSILCLMEAANCATSVLPPELGRVSTCAKNTLQQTWRYNFGHCVV